MVKVVWTTSALEDLDNIGEYIGKRLLKVCHNNRRRII
jgi:hypothetical protein